jgi:hypothetical protein
MSKISRMMDRKKRYTSGTSDLEYIMSSVNESTYDHGGNFKANPSSIIAISRGEREKRTERTGGVSIGFPKYRWLLLLGDLALIAIGSILSPWIRLGVPLDTFTLYTTASVTTLAIYPMTLYIFDLYNVERVFRSWETAVRSALAIGLGGFIVIISFYLLPHGPYGRGIMAIQLAMVWLFLNGWRWAYGFLFQTAIPKIPTLILGAGFCGKTIYGLLKSPLSPYEIKGFLDDDPEKFGRTSSPAVIGACEDLTEIAARVGANTAILAIPKNRSSRLIRDILHARLQGINIRDMADVYEELTGRIPVRNIGDQWLLFAEGFICSVKNTSRRSNAFSILSYRDLYCSSCSRSLVSQPLPYVLIHPDPYYTNNAVPEKVNRNLRFISSGPCTLMRKKMALAGPPKETRG